MMIFCTDRVSCEPDVAPLRKEVDPREACPMPFFTSGSRRNFEHSQMQCRCGSCGWHSYPDAVSTATSTRLRQVCRSWRRVERAADAAVAIQMVLGLVEPQSSGLGGGAIVLYRDERDRSVHAFDG